MSIASRPICCLSTRSIICLADRSLATTSLHSATNLTSIFASAYRTDTIRPLPTLPTRFEYVPFTEINPAQVSGIPSNLNPSKAPDPGDIHHSFLRMVAPIISQPQTCLFSLLRSLVWLFSGRLAPGYSSIPIQERLTSRDFVLQTY